ncbi:sorbosone dehydrogenase family protein [Rhodoplanes sp. TEM]|uniref:Sorbosone dehydrogenase family protein n=1 Tax=Rhodoplanes tepidamans TaxID=200616 RepID=A0ABT5J8Q0_RHOTP|nr:MULTISPECIES: sorbosone dehydrogenase family protein [Rhodoplanes]MDC7785435.1 sorbosone dehydrogenase family protein [Rhodoplanes tepidamans]MDC7985784.1 sorbosone dehydrogenase family protein [Rhodoplanes sp. TEM]MDQ0353111.1 glucose/arabinose dehydrogenase [Rhodoplanes tepidamans]
MARSDSPAVRAGLLALLGAAAAGLAACGDSAQVPYEETVGASPTLPPPNPSLIPTIDIAPANRWAADAKPTAAAGLAVTALARDLDHPRSLLMLPNGDVLVAETNAPEKEGSGGIRGFVMNQVMKRAGARVPSADRITLLRDTDGDGTADLRSTFLENLHSPFGMTLVGDTLYVANTDAVVKVPYQEGQTRIDAPPEKVADLPAGPINHHWTKGLAASPDGSKLYASVGSNSNVAENGMENETNRAAILEIDPATGQSRLYASGLRNPVDIAFQPGTGQLWAVVNERDEIGSDLVPDYLTSVRDGAFYGWPYSYWGQHVDTRVEPQRPDMVAKAVKPDYALGNHVAPLGLAFATGTTLPEQFRDGVFVGLHGSWNRKPPSGYKVVFVPFRNGAPSGMPVDVLTGFLAENGEANGRPVGVAVARDGALLVADDVGNTVWRVAPPAARTSGG